MLASCGETKVVHEAPLAEINRACADGKGGVYLVGVDGATWYAYEGRARKVKFIESIVGEPAPAK